MNIKKRILSFVRHAIVGPTLLWIIALQRLFSLGVCALDGGQHIVHVLYLGLQFLAQTALYLTLVNLWQSLVAQPRHTICSA